MTTVEKPAICFVTTTTLIVQFFLRDLLNALAKDFQVSLIVNIEDQTVREWLDPSVHICHIPLRRKIAPVSDLVNLFRLARHFARHRYNVVHSIAPKAGLLTMSAARLAGIPRRVHTFTGVVWATRTGIGRWMLRVCDRMTARFATHCLFDSESGRQFLRREAVLSPAKGDVLHHGSFCGVDTARFHPDPRTRKELRSRFSAAPDDFVILYVGRLTRDKGVLDLALSFRELARRKRNACLWYVGPDEEALSERIARITAGFSERVHILGHSYHPEDYMQAADLVCLPSHREGFGLVLIEAAACGLPAVASRITGVVDAVREGVTGLLYKAGSTRELTAALEEMINHPDLRGTLAAQARKHVLAQFDQKDVLAAYSSFYRMIL